MVPLAMAANEVLDVIGVLGSAALPVPRRVTNMSSSWFSGSGT